MRRLPLRTNAAPRAGTARGVAFAAALVACVFAASCGDDGSGTRPAAPAGAAPQAPGPRAPADPSGFDVKIEPGEDPVAPVTNPPDVIVLVMDTARADRCSLYGYPRPTTPRLEELAKESIVFDDAWSPGSWTVPSHAALFTGRLPETLGLLRPTRPILPGNVPTLAGILGARGWATSCFTWNPWISPVTGLTRGFGKDVDPLYVGRPLAASREGHQRALRWMQGRRSAGQRFFCFINDMEPHSPYEPPEAQQARFVDPSVPEMVVADARRVDGPRMFRLSCGAEPPSAEQTRTLRDLYDAEIATLDAEIGLFVDGLRRAGLLDRTLLVIAGDHGEGLADHGWWEHGVLLHRELLRVPLLVRPPGGTQGRRVTDVVRLHDVFATVLEACGIGIPKGIDSRSLAGDVKGRIAVASESRRDELLQRVQEAIQAPLPPKFAAARRSAYDGRFHLIVDDAGRTELFDVRADPLETTDLSAAQPEAVARLRAAIDAR